VNEIVQAARAAKRFDFLQVIDQELGARERFLGAGFEEIVELLVFAEEFLERDHEGVVATGLCGVCEMKIPGGAGIRRA
jgi:hypothetical protein